MTTPPHVQLGARLRTARVKKGISQENFAPLVGTTRRHLIRLEGGKHRPNAALLARIAEETGQPLSFFDVREPQEVAAPVPGTPFRGSRGGAAADRAGGNGEGRRVTP